MSDTANERLPLPYNSEPVPMWKVQAVDTLPRTVTRGMVIVVDGLVIVDERTWQTGPSEPCGEGGSGGYCCSAVPGTVAPIRDR